MAIEVKQDGSEVHPHVEKVLFDKEQIAQRVKQLGREIAIDFKDKAPLLLGVLTGSFMFMSGTTTELDFWKNELTLLLDLVKEICPVPQGTDLNFIRASSYIGKSTTTNNNVEVQINCKEMVKDRNVIVVEDIVDTGHTLDALTSSLQKCGAASVTIVTLLNKTERREVDVSVNYVAFMCPNEFVIGYGMDYDELYRTLPYVGVLKPEIYSE